MSDGVHSNQHRADYEEWARYNIGQFDPSGFYGTGGLWHYRHNFMHKFWLCWIDARKGMYENSGITDEIAKLEQLGRQCNRVETRGIGQAIVEQAERFRDILKSSQR